MQLLLCKCFLSWLEYGPKFGPVMCSSRPISEIHLVYTYELVTDEIYKKQI